MIFCFDCSEHVFIRKYLLITIKLEMVQEQSVCLIFFLLTNMYNVIRQKRLSRKYYVTWII